MVGSNISNMLMNKGVNYMLCLEIFVQFTLLMQVFSSMGSELGLDTSYVAG